MLVGLIMQIKKNKIFKKIIIAPFMFILSTSLAFIPSISQKSENQNFSLFKSKMISHFQQTNQFYINLNLMTLIFFKIVYHLNIKILIGIYLSQLQLKVQIVLMEKNISKIILRHCQMNSIVYCMERIIFLLKH